MLNTVPGWDCNRRKASAGCQLGRKLAQAAVMLTLGLSMGQLALPQKHDGWVPGANPRGAGGSSMTFKHIIFFEIHMYYDPPI